MAKAIVVIKSKDVSTHEFYMHHIEKDFLDELNEGVMKESGARLVSYSGDASHGFKAVVEVDA